MFFQSMIKYQTRQIWCRQLDLKLFLFAKKGKQNVDMDAWSLIIRSVYRPLSHKPTRCRHFRHVWFKGCVSRVYLFTVTESTNFCLIHVIKLYFSSCSTSFWGKNLEQVVVECVIIIYADWRVTVRDSI